MAVGPGYLFIVGAPKSGTTSLAVRLEKSDKIALVQGKEPKFFTDFGNVDWTGPGIKGFIRSLVQEGAEYEALFDHEPNTSWRLDASTDYLSCDASPKLIADFSKKHNSKVIVIVRDPVERIVSEFQHTLRAHMQTGSLSQSLAAESERVAKNWHPLFHHIKRSSYASKIAKYRDLFDENLLILDFHELIVGNESLDTVTDFLGIPALDEEVAPAHLNRSYAPRSQVLSSALRSRRLKRVSRLLVPKPLRPLVWRIASQANQTQYSPTQKELTQLRVMLADEITACESDPDIPTDHWHLARGNAPQHKVRATSVGGVDASSLRY